MKKLSRGLLIFGILATGSLIATGSIEYMAHEIKIDSIREFPTEGPASVRNVAPREAGASLPVIMGSVIYSSAFQSVSDYGLYNVSTTDGMPSLQFNGPYALHGGVCVGGIYYASAILNDVPTVKTYDIETGERLTTFTAGLNAMAPAGYALDPVTNQVYGITYGETQNECQLSRLTFSLTGVTVEKIASLYIEDYWLSLAFDSKGQLYAISRDNVYMYAYLNKMDKNTGSYTQIGRIEGGGWLYPQYKSAACIDPETDVMYVNVCPSLVTGSNVYTGYLYSVNLQTAQAQKIYQYADNAEIMGMFIPEKVTPGGAPGACSDPSAVFSDATMKGVVSLRTPVTSYDGNSPEGSCDIMVSCNGKIIGSLSAQSYNSFVSVPVDLTGFSAGLYSFSVYAQNDLGKGPAVETDPVWVGADTPAATTATLRYENNMMTVEWLPVTETVNGGFLDTENLRYNVRRSDGSLAASGLKVTTFSEPVVEPNKQTTYFYVVEAVTGSLVSAPAQTNTVTIGALRPPYFSDFANGLDGWTIINSNNDQYVWEAKNEGVQIRYNASLDMDDWLVSPALKLQAGKTYSVSFKTKCYNQTERLEVMYGTGNTVAELKNTAMAPFEISNSNDFQLHEAFIVPDADGDYFFGFHGISDANAMVLYLKDIQITGGAVANAPDMVTNLKVVPDNGADLKCTVTFNAPVQTVNHNPLESITKIEVMRNGIVVKTFENPQPGAALSYIDTPSQAGLLLYQVVAYNDAGAGVEASATSFVGIDVPMAPSNVVMNTTNVDGQVILNWDAVTTDVNGNPIPVEDITYSVARYYIGWTEIVTGLTSTTYSYQAVNEGQDFVQLAVYAYDKAGRSEASVTGVLPVGTPYDGMTESFPNGKLTSYIWYQRSINGGSAGLFNSNSVEEVVAQDGDNGFLGIYGEEEGAGASFFSGLISLKNFDHPALSFGINCFTIDVWNPVTVSVREQGQQDWTILIDATRVTDLCTRLGWNTVTVPLDKFAGKVIQLQISAVTEYYQYTFFDNIVVGADSSSVSTICNDNNIMIMPVKKGVVIAGANDLDITVSAANGALVYSGIGKPETHISLDSGLYIIKAGNATRKIIVR